MLWLTWLRDSLSRLTSRQMQKILKSSGLRLQSYSSREHWWEQGLQRTQWVIFQLINKASYRVMHTLFLNYKMWMEINWWNSGTLTVVLVQSGEVTGQIHVPTGMQEWEASLNTTLKILKMVFSGWMLSISLSNFHMFTFVVFSHSNKVGSNKYIKEHGKVHLQKVFLTAKIQVLVLN